jgi:hypothetical protein
MYLDLGTSLYHTWLLYMWERDHNSISLEDWVGPKFGVLVVASGKTPDIATD